MMHVLFLCSQNRLRSPTAERIFSTREGIEVESAGLDNNAENVITPDQIRWSDLIFVMEKSHKNKLVKKYKNFINGKRIICLDISDEYDYMDPKLISILKAKVERFLINK
jgi:predicted protein tyrosine phosphatase